jgi:hypothetical protein
MAHLEGERHFSGTVHFALDGDGVWRIKFF